MCNIYEELNPVDNNFLFAQYTFKNICMEEKELILKDESTKYFFNAKAANKAKDVETRAFLEYIKNGKPTDSFTKKINSKVKNVKQNEALRGIYMCEPIRIQDAKWAARVEVAKKLLKEGDSLDKVARCADLPLEKVKELAEEISKK